MGLSRLPASWCRCDRLRKPVHVVDPDSSPSVSPAPPFSSGSVSIRLYPHNDLPADHIVSELSAQAGLALGSGFDGVMTSEHHGGFAGYMAQPLQIASFVLGEHTTGWAAAAPLLLPLRSTALVAEEVRGSRLDIRVVSESGSPQAPFRWISNRPE